MNAKAQITMNDVYRRLHYFHDGDLNSNLIYLGYPSEVKPLYKYLKPVGNEKSRSMNWYCLTQEGKDLFATIPPMEKKDNSDFFVGNKRIDFNDYLKNSVAV